MAHPHLDPAVSPVGCAPAYLEQEAMKNFVVGCTVAVLVGMVFLAVGHERQECPDGHRIKTLQPCGSMTYYVE